MKYLGFVQRSLQSVWVCRECERHLCSVGVEICAKYEQESVKDCETHSVQGAGLELGSGVWV